MARNELFDMISGDPASFGIVSNPQIEELLRKQKEDQTRMLTEQRAQNDRFDLGKQVQLEDEPGNNVFNEALLGMMRRGVDEKAESFDEFFDRKFTALNFLGDMARGAAAGRNGTKFVSTRERLMDEYKVDQGLKLKRQEMEQSNQQVAVQIAAASQRQQEQLGMQYRLAAIKNATSERDYNEQVRQFEAKFGQDSLKMMIDVDESRADARRKELESPIPAFEQANKEVARANPKLDITSPEFNALARTRAEEIINDEMNRDLGKITAREVARAKFKPQNNIPSEIISATAESVAKGMTLIDATRIVGKENISAMGAELLGRKRQTPEFRKQAVQIQENLSMVTQLRNLVFEAQESGALGKSDEEILADPTLRKNITDKVNGWLAGIEGGMGLNPAAKVVEQVSTIAARKMAKAAGEGGRMSDQDAVQFAKALPNLANGQVDMAKLSEFNRKQNAQTLLEAARGLGSFGKVQPEMTGATPVDRFIKVWNDFNNPAATEKQKRASEDIRKMLGSTDLTDAVIKALEQGLITDAVK